MRMKMIGAAVSLAVLCFVAGPAAAQWRYYDGYQANPAYPDYPREYDNYPVYQGEPWSQPSRRSPQPSPYYQSPDDDTTASIPRSPGALEDRDFEAARSQRTARIISNPTKEPPGTIVIDTASRHLYYVQADGQAIEYGIGVGREGFAWKGTAQVGRKAEWPRWIPPDDMLRRRPDLPTSMEGGLENPLGARALYLFKGKTDTLFRIHGTNEPDSIGKAVSSGCIRMMNADVMDLYKRVPVGTRVVVL